MKDDGYGLFDRLFDYLGVDLSASLQVFSLNSEQKSIDLTIEKLLQVP